MKRIKREHLNVAVAAAKQETHDALQTVFNALNQGQQKKIIKDAAVKELFDRFGVDYE